MKDKNYYKKMARQSDDLMNRLEEIKRKLLKGLLELEEELQDDKECST